MDEGLYDNAIQAAQRSIAIHPSTYGYSNLGSSYFFQKRYDEAIQAYEQAIQFSQNDPLLWWNLGDGYYWASGRRADSAGPYRKCAEFSTAQLKQNSNDTEKYGILAICEAMLGQKDAANTALNRGFHLAPDDP
jgi:tetratricopeptide (TPR) repeat protein